MKLTRARYNPWIVANTASSRAPASGSCWKGSEKAVFPTHHRRGAVNTRGDEIGLILDFKVGERSASALQQYLTRNEPVPVPPVQHRRLDVVCIGEIHLTVQLERMPVVAPFGRELLELLETAPGPFVDH